jgi:chromosome segregation ATPase
MNIQTVKEYIKKHQYLDNNTKSILIEEILNIELDIEKLKINLYEIEKVNNELNHYLKEMISFNKQLQEGNGTNLFTTNKINEYNLEIESNKTKIDEINQSIQVLNDKVNKYEIDYPIFFNSKPQQKIELKFI